ncbi:MAG: hypothetical protein EBR30_07625 [Cytophagia bacterium]|nr:hypothetical protein [Cytophagia bacterium]
MERLSAELLYLATNQNTQHMKQALIYTALFLVSGWAVAQNSKGLIYIIKVITIKDTRLMKGMELALGKSEWDLRNEQYFWKAENLTLTFKAIEKDKIELTYTSFPVLKKMKDDKKKEVEDIADDF